MTHTLVAIGIVLGLLGIVLTIIALILDNIRVEMKSVVHFLGEINDKLRVLAYHRDKK